MRIGKKYVPPLALLVVSTLVTAYAATTLFTQTLPAVGAVTFTGNCTTLTPSAIPVSGSSGSVDFDCSGTSPFGTTAAITRGIAGNSWSLYYSPKFTLPSAYADLFTRGTSAASQSTTPCSSQPSTAAITSGQTIGSGGFGLLSFDYCADFTSVPSTGLPSFTITWTILPPISFYQFSQTFSSTGSVSVVALCKDLTANDTGIVIGSSGVVKFDCSGSSPFGTTPAFTASSGQLTPTFVLTSTGYTALAVVSGSAPVTSCITSTTITSGTAVSLTEGQYDYCATFASATSIGLGTFSVMWS